MAAKGSNNDDDDDDCNNNNDDSNDDDDDVILAGHVINLFSVRTLNDYEILGHCDLILLPAFPSPLCLPSSCLLSASPLGNICYLLHALR